MSSLSMEFGALREVLSLGLGYYGLGNVQRKQNIFWLVSTLQIRSELQISHIWLWMSNIKSIEL
jgi:hypothetical protein